MDTEVSYRNVNPPVNTHADTIGSVVGTTALKEFRRAYILDKRLGRTVSYTVMVFIFQNNQIHSGSLAGFLGESGV
ncbi:hypothetical protein D3C86_1866720 [compost metagenome]